MNVWNPEARADNQYKILTDETKVVANEGKTYQVRKVLVENNAYNLGNGATAKTLTMVVVYRLKKDGTPGLKLTNWNFRLSEVFNAAFED